MKKIILSILLIVATVISVSSCAVVPVDDPEPTKVTREKGDVVYTPVGSKTTDLLSEISAGKISYSPDVDQKEYLKKLLSFYVDVFGKTLDEDTKKSSLVSPLSVALALGMVADGADGNTKDEFEELFGMTTEALDQVLSRYMNSLISTEHAKFKAANSIWLSTDDNLSVNEEYLQRIYAYYHPSAYAVDFTEKSTVKAVNKWVKENTDDMIDKIVDELDPRTVMVLINALVFDAKWRDEYETFRVRDEKFTDINGKKQDAKLMHSTEYRYIDYENAVGFAKPYMGNYSFVALLPDENINIFDFASSLDANKLYDALNTRSDKYDEVHAAIPKFEYDYDIELSETLKSLGLCDAFSGLSADFSNMATYDGQNIYISDVIHKTHIELNEVGTRAAAVTLIEMKCGSAEPREKKTIDITLDRPFVYMIVDTANNMPLFMGVVTGIDK